MDSFFLGGGQFDPKNHKKAGFHLLFRKHIFGKTTVGGQLGGQLYLSSLMFDNLTKLAKILTR